MASAREFPFYAALWRGFYDREFYVNVARKWRGRGFAFMALVVLLTLLPATIFSAQMMNKFIDEEFPYLLPEFPTIRLVEGRAVSEVEQPYYLNGSDGEKLLAIDTTGKVKTPQEAGVQVLITAEAILIAAGAAEAFPMPVGWLQLDGTISANSLQAIANWLQGGGYIISSVFAFILTYCFRLLMSAAYALAGRFFARQQNLEMDFSALYQISLVAQGLSLLTVYALTFLLALIGVMSFGSVGGAMIVLFLIWYGVKANHDWVAGNLPPLKERF